MITCPVCGFENAAGAKFCSECGSPLAAATAPREERKVVTVLFCDLVGFTGRAESMDPEDVRALLSGYHERVRGELERHGGTVEKFAGDAVLAMFGAPRAHEDDPERAVRAALAIRDWAMERNGLRVRIGITTGEALVTLDARAGAGEAMASGDVVNTAARLQTAAPENAILVDEATYRATRSTIVYAGRDPVEAKGKARPVPAHEALETRSRLGVDVAARAATPLVGRGTELRLLVDALARTRREAEPQLVTLIGVPGIGKSRLVTELLRVVDEDPDLIVWRQGRSLPYGEGLSYWALSEMVKAQAGILETDSAADVERKLGSAVHDAVDDRADWVEQHLRPLVGLAGGTGEDRRTETFAAWRNFLEAVAERTPTVLVFEDIQWADDGLLDFVDHLVDWASGVPLLVVCTARPELLARRSAWGGGKPNASTISLSPLSSNETAQLVHAILNRAALPADLQAALLQRAGGNPLYAEEFARMVDERGELPEAELPESVQGIIAARLDALETSEKALLQDAAVVGKVFWSGAVARLSDRDRFEVEDVLHGLERRELVRRERRSSLAHESEYAFRHLLVRDVAYNQVPRAPRAEKHRLAAEWIETLGRLEGQAEMLAHHYARAIELGRAAGLDTSSIVAPAVDALIEAGERARALYAYGSAAAYYERALELGARDGARGGDVLLGYAESRHHAEGYTSTDMDELLFEARDRLADAGDLEGAAWAEVLLARSLWSRGVVRRASEGYERAIELVSARPATPGKARVIVSASRSAMVGDRHQQAIALASEALELAEQLGLAEIESEALMTIGTSRVELGEPGGIEDTRRSIEVAGATPIATRGYMDLADQLIELGDIAGGIDARKQGTALAERLGIAPARDWLRAERAGELYVLGEWQQALDVADEFVRWSNAGVRHYMEVACRLVRGGILLARGDVEAAVADGRAALELGRETAEPQGLYPSLSFAARAELVAGRPDGASALLDELVNEIQAHGTLPIGYVWLRGAAVSLHDLGRGADFLEATASSPKRTPWLLAATAIARGEPALAVERYAALGAKPDEALARLMLGEALAAEGRPAEAAKAVQPAIDFLRSVAATALLRRAEILLAESA